MSIGAKKDALWVNWMFQFLGLFPGVTQTSKMLRKAPEKEVLQYCNSDADTIHRMFQFLELFPGVTQSSEMSRAAKKEMGDFAQWAWHNLTFDRKLCKFYDHLDFSAEY